MIAPPKPSEVFHRHGLRCPPDADRLLWCHRLADAVLVVGGWHVAAWREFFYVAEIAHVTAAEDLARFARWHPRRFEVVVYNRDPLPPELEPALTADCVRVAFRPYSLGDTE